MANYEVDWHGAFTSLMLMLLTFTLLNFFLLTTKALYGMNTAFAYVIAMLSVSFIINIKRKSKTYK